MCSNIRTLVQTKSEDYRHQCPKTSLFRLGTNVQSPSLSSYLKTREPILDLVDDVLIGDPAHVEVTLERRVSVLPSLIIDQILKLVTRTNLLLSNGSACYKSNKIWPL